jgi:hypothetical protein
MAHSAAYRRLPCSDSLLVRWARLAEKQHKRAHDQHCDHHDLELVDDPDESRLTGDHIVESGSPGSAIEPVT